LNQNFRQKFHVINNFDDKIYQIKFFIKISCNKWFLTELLLNQNFIQKFHVINDFNDRTFIESKFHVINDFDDKIYLQNSM
jgi:hypothetical protein